MLDFHPEVEEACIAFTKLAAWISEPCGAYIRSADISFLDEHWIVDLHSYKGRDKRLGIAIIKALEKYKLEAPIYSSDLF